MQIQLRQYLILISAHLVLAIVIFAFLPLSKLYAILIFIIGISYIIKTQNKNNEALLVCGYIIGAEVFIRATSGAFLYEFAKYGVIFIMLLGMYYSSFSRNVFPYIIYLLLFLPALYYAISNFILTDNDRKLISFTMSGPVCLGVCAVYCYQRRVSIDMIYNILLAIGLPLISLTVYLILFNPVVLDVITGTDSSGATSGGFGPNQVSTMVGLGIFVFFSRALLNSKSKLETFINLSITTIMTFRGIVTFSRGGVLTAFLICSVLVINIYFLANNRSKFKILLFAIATFLISVSIWSYSVLQTNGLIANRYSGQDAMGRVKASRFTGREDLVATEIKLFFQYPIFGCGVSRSIKIRETETGVKAASHNEITRLIAEHGFLGLLILVVLFATPFLLYLGNKEHFFMLSFFVFWLLTINHAAMRVAAPAFVYALCLLQVNYKSVFQQAVSS